MTETITARVRAHLEAACVKLDRLVQLVVTSPDARLAELPLLESPINAGHFIEEWRGLFARAGSRVDALTNDYRRLTQEMLLVAGAGTALRCYANAETARRRLLPFPDVGRPRMTPAVTLFAIAMHNLLWLVRNRPPAADEDDETAGQADLVLVPLRTLAESDSLEIGDLMAITELSRWVVNVLSGSRGSAATIPLSFVTADEGPTPTMQPSTRRAAIQFGRHLDAEAWLAAAVEVFRPEFAARGYDLRGVNAFARRPARDPGLAFHRPLGRALWRSDRPGFVDIEIDPALTDPIGILLVLKHELVHGALYGSNPHHGHGRQFREAATAVGMRARGWRGRTSWTTEGRADAAAIAQTLGPFPKPQRGLEPLSETLETCLLALRTLSPIARIDGAADGARAYEEWADKWPALRRLVAAPEAATLRQELVSRLGLRLAASGLTDVRLAGVLSLLARLDRQSNLHREHWLAFVAALLAAALGATADARNDPMRWVRWTQEPDGQRSMAYWTGRVARIAEDLAADRATHQFPGLVWRWREIARETLVSWLDARGHAALCLGHWLEGLLDGSDRVPSLIIGRRISGFGLVDIVDLWQRSGELDPDSALDLDGGVASDLQAALKVSHSRLGASSVMTIVLGDTRQTGVRSRARDVAPATVDKVADLVRYAGAKTPPGSDRKRPAEAPHPATSRSVTPMTARAKAQEPPGSTEPRRATLDSDKAEARSDSPAPPSEKSDDPFDGLDLLDAEMARLLDGQALVRSAEGGDAAAQNDLGRRLEKGEGLPQDLAEAARWYRKAADQGYAVAQTNLGYCYSQGRGVAQNLAEAARWYRKAADQGNAAAQTNLGLFYYKGRGVSQDLPEAARWYRKAADQGYAAAQTNLGICFENRKGVTQDPAEAARWYRKAADQGYAVAQFNLGVCFENGRGVTQDPAEAARWYRKAADQGHATAAERYRSIQSWIG